jgi:hypothetical protein
MTVTVGAYSLCDGTLAGGVAVSDLRVAQRRIADVVSILAGVSPNVYDRVGRPCVYSFTVKRTHADLDAAEQFIIGLEDALPASGDIDITTTGPTPATFVIPNAKVQSHDLQQQCGATTFHNYSIIGGPPPTET